MIAGAVLSCSNQLPISSDCQRFRFWADAHLGSGLRCGFIVGCALGKANGSRFIDSWTLDLVDRHLEDLEMNRRSFLRQLAAIPALSIFWPRLSRAAEAVVPSAGLPSHRVRPSDPSWPTEAAWEKLRDEVGGHRHLIKVESPLAACVSAPDSKSCDDVFKSLKNPYYIGDNAAL